MTRDTGNQKALTRAIAHLQSGQIPSTNLSARNLSQLEQWSWSTLSSAVLSQKQTQLTGHISPEKVERHEPAYISPAKWTDSLDKSVSKESVTVGAVELVHKMRQILTP
jgi:hypothetical protein